MKKRMSVGSWVLAVIVVLAVAVGTLYVMHRMEKHSPPAAGAALPAATDGASTAAPPIRHPIAQASAPAAASTAALPPLHQSDDDVVAALLALAGGDAGNLLVSQQIVARIVATIDALPRRALGTFLLPAHPPKGAFATVESDGQIAMATQNAARYAPYMQVLEHVDPAALVAWYVHAYPLFQQAYRELGYPKGYFNDRLIVVIDDLLAAPEPAQPALLRHSKSYYVFADPALESLSAGQKLLLRAGPGNEALIKAKLRAIRASLIGSALPAPATSTEG